MILTPGKFYRASNGAKWCCFRVDLLNKVHCQAWCINVTTHVIEYFFIDGRYDAFGLREHCLVEELTSPA